MRQGVNDTAGKIPVGFAIMITCSAYIHEYCHILLMSGQTATLSKTRLIPLILFLVVAWSLSSCELLRDEPSNRAIATIKNYASMPGEEFTGESTKLAMRERQVFIYLRALQVQGGKLSYSIDSIDRRNPAHRQVVVVVSERSGIGQKKERARFTVELSRDAKKAWGIDSFELIE